MAAKFEQELEAAIADGVVIGAALIAVNSKGQTLINKAFGKAGVGNDAPDFSMDTMFWLASSTKLLASICALQLVEAGKLSPELPIYDVLPELKDLPICLGYDKSGQPILKPSTKPITLTHLLTHSSGIGYDIFNPFLAKYRQATGMKPFDRMSAVPETYPSVLLFEPGDGWEYSPGIDWVGLAVERVTGMTLGEYMQQHIFDKVGMKDTTFAPWTRPELMKRMHGRVTRGPDRKIVIFENEALFPMTPRGFDSGGGGLFSCSSDYIKVLQSLVTCDEKLLKHETVKKYMMTGQLQPEARRAMNDTIWTEHWQRMGAVGLTAPGGDDLLLDHGLASAVVTAPIDGVCNQGMMYWGGIPNNNWWVDINRGTAGHYGTWIVPVGDVETGRLFGKFREAIFAEAA